MFMPKEIKHEREIMAVLDHQLVNLRTYNQDPRAPAQDMAGLRSTYVYEKNEVLKANEMLKTGQVPIDVNAMPGLVMDESEDKKLDQEGSLNALQSGDSCFFCKKTGHKKRKYGSNTRTSKPHNPISCLCNEKYQKKI